MALSLCSAAWKLTFAIFQILGLCVINVMRQLVFQCKFEADKNSKSVFDYYHMIIICFIDSKVSLL